MPNLVKMARALQTLLDPKVPSDDTSGEVLDSLIKDYLYELSRCHDEGTLRAVLVLDDFYLPVDVMKVTYERLLGLVPDDETILRNYADFLYRYGPDWDDVADQIMSRLAKREENC